MSRLEKFAFTFGAGVVTGAVLAPLYTSITGEKLQKKVADLTDKVIDSGTTCSSRCARSRMHD